MTAGCVRGFLQASLGSCLINLGLTEVERGAYAEAIECNRRAIDEFERIGHASGRAIGHSNLAWALAQAGRYEEARSAIRKALAQHTPDAEILFHAGMIYARLGDRVTAQKFLYEALSMNPHFHPAHPATAASCRAGSSRRTEDAKEEGRASVCPCCQSRSACAGC